MSNSNISENKDSGYLDLLPSTNEPSTIGNEFQPQLVITPASANNEHGKSDVHTFLQQQLKRRTAIKEELRANGDLVQRIRDVCKDKPVVVITPRHPHTPSFFAGSVAMSNEVDVMFTITAGSFKGDTHFAIHQPKKHPEDLQGVQLKQSPKNVFVQLGNGAVYWAANHHHAQAIHSVLCAEAKQIRNNFYTSWKENV